MLSSNFSCSELLEKLLTELRPSRVKGASLTDKEGFVFLRLGMLFGAFSKAYKGSSEIPLRKWCDRAYRNPPEPLTREELEDMLDDASEFFHRPDIQNEEVNDAAQALVGALMEALNG